MKAKIFISASVAFLLIFIGSITAAEKKTTVDVMKVVHGIQQTTDFPNGDFFPFGNAKFELSYKDSKTNVVTEFFQNTHFANQVTRLSNETVGKKSTASTALLYPSAILASFSGTGIASLSPQACDCEKVWDTSLYLTGELDSNMNRIQINGWGKNSSPIVEFSYFFEDKELFVSVKGLPKGATLHINDRFANDHSKLRSGRIHLRNIGDNKFISPLITIAIGKELSDYLGCTRLAIDFLSGGWPGKSGIVFSEIVVETIKKPGDEMLQGTGLLGNLSGGYPTGLICSTCH